MSSNEISLAGSSSANHGSNGVESPVPVNWASCPVQDSLRAGDCPDSITPAQYRAIPLGRTAYEDSMRFCWRVEDWQKSRREKRMSAVITRAATLRKMMSSVSQTSKSLEQVMITMSSREAGGHGKCSKNMRALEVTAFAAVVLKKVREFEARASEMKGSVVTPAFVDSMVAKYVLLCWELAKVAAENADTTAVIMGE